MTDAFHTTADLVGYVLWRARELTDGRSAWHPWALRYLNLAYEHLALGGLDFTPTAQVNWWFLRQSPPGVLALDPVLAGQMALTAGSVAGTLAVPPGAGVSLVGWVLRVFSEEETATVARRISVHAPGGTGIEFDLPWRGPSTSSAVYEAYHLEYTLPATVLRLLSPAGLSHPTPEGTYDLAVAERAAAHATLMPWPEIGVPSRATFIGQQALRMNRAGRREGPVRVEYDAIVRPPLLALPGDAEVPYLPREYRYVLADMALSYVFRDKNDSRADGQRVIAQQGIAALLKEQDYRTHIADPDFGRALTSPARRRRRWAVSTSGVRF